MKKFICVSMIAITGAVGFLYGACSVGDCPQKVCSKSKEASCRIVSECSSDSTECKVNCNSELTEEK